MKQQPFLFLCSDYYDRKIQVKANGTASTHENSKPKATSHS